MNRDFLKVIAGILRKTGHADLAKTLLKESEPRGVRLVRGYDLRVPLEVKVDDAVKDTRDWTIYLNKKGSLAHAVLWDRHDVMVRLPGLHLKGASDAFCVEELEKRIDL